MTACASQSAPEVQVGDTSRPLQEAWWSWAAREPYDSNPVVDPTGEFCDRNQGADVWFFAGTFGGQAQRECSVPAGRPIVAPVVNQISELPADCDGFMKNARGTAELDGEPLEVERVDGERITIETDSDNPVVGKPGRFPVIACGLWIHIEPPAAGAHALRIRGASGDLVVDVDYHFDVIEGTGRPG
jgi:hypothetical protein